MINRVTKLRVRRAVRRRKQQVGDIGDIAEEHLEKHLIRRLTRLWEVRRFVLSWVCLLVLLAAGLIMQARSLSPYYQTLKPAPGGTYTEGIVGAFTNANPLYATGAVDSAVARLVFAGLLKYDQNNQLIGDLAESWQVDATESLYTVVLKPNVVWHDGRPLTASDVVFTYQLIQNPDAKSPYLSSWQGITIAANDERTVTFQLPNALSAFPHSLTSGIVPRHLLEGIPTGQLRSISFNTAAPVGAGPFKWQTVEVRGDTPEDREERVGLVPNENYHAGMPALSQFVIRAFRDERGLIDSFLAGELNAAVGLSHVPDEVRLNSTVEARDVPLTGEVMVFFKISHDIFGEARLRRALVQSINTQAVVKELGYPVIGADSPLLRTHTGYTREVTQLPYNLAEANRLLDELGWVKDPATGLRGKDGKPLAFRLFSQSTSEYTSVSQALQKQWRELGVDMQVSLLPEQDLQGVIAGHTYEALLYGISLGSDPDVFAYWHSTQADLRSKNRLNFSEYNSKIADRALEAGRTRSDLNLRSAKYRPFLESWRDDAPALALYQPRFLYLVRKPLHGFDAQTINTGPDRYFFVNQWMIRQERITN